VILQKHQADTLAGELIQAQTTIRAMQPLWDAYRPLATRFGVFYFVVAQLEAVHPVYRHSLHLLRRRLLRNIRDCGSPFLLPDIRTMALTGEVRYTWNGDAEDGVVDRCTMLGDVVLLKLFREVGRGLEERDKELFSVLLCGALQRHAASTQPPRPLYLHPPPPPPLPPHAGSYWPIDSITEAEWLLFLQDPTEREGQFHTRRAGEGSSPVAALVTAAAGNQEGPIPSPPLASPGKALPDNPDETWITPAAWSGICGAETASRLGSRGGGEADGAAPLDWLKGITQLIVDRPGEWKVFAVQQSGDPAWQLSVGLPVPASRPGSKGARGGTDHPSPLPSRPRRHSERLQDDQPHDLGARRGSEMSDRSGAGRADFALAPPGAASSGLSGGNGAKKPPEEKRVQGFSRDAEGRIKRFSPWQRLCLLRLLRPAGIQPVLAQHVRNILGEEYTDYAVSGGSGVASGCGVGTLGEEGNQGVPVVLLHHEDAAAAERLVELAHQRSVLSQPDPTIGRLDAAAVGANHIGEPANMGLLPPVAESVGSGSMESPGLSRRSSTEGAGGFLPGVHAISTVSVGNPKAAGQAVLNARLHGGWVVVRNSDTDPGEARRLALLAQNGSKHDGSVHRAIHPDFRIILAARLAPRAAGGRRGAGGGLLPWSLLAGSVKVFAGAGAGMRCKVINSLQGTRFAYLEEEEARSGNPGKFRDEKGVERWNELRKIRFSLVVLHAALQERGRFGSMGWVVPYDFHESDLQGVVGAVEDILRGWSLERPVPWGSLCHLVSRVYEGGRVLHDHDRVTLEAILPAYLCPGTTSDDNYCYATQSRASFLPRPPRDGPPSTRVERRVYL